MKALKTASPRAKTVLALVAMAMFGAGLGGCSTVEKLNVFDKKKNRVIASEGERIPLIALNQKLEVSDVLKDQKFFLPAPQPVTSWPQPGGALDRWIENLDAGAQFKIAWRKSFGQGSKRGVHVTAPPVAADGRVYVMDAEAHVSAIDAASGERVWRTDVALKTKRDKTAFGGGVAYADGKIFVTSGYRFVAALNAATGKLIWRTKVDAPIHDAPTIIAGRVYAISVDDELMSFDIQTGDAGWTYQALTEPARILSASSPAASGDTVVAAFASGELTALRAVNGNQEWTAVLSRTSRTNALSEIRDIAGRPVIFKGDVFAGSHSGLFMTVDLRTGTPRWTLPVATITTPWPAGDVVYLISQAGQVICASRESGQVYWINELNKGLKRKKRSLYYGPVLASGRLIVASDDGKMLELDPQTGAVKSTLKVGSAMLMPPIAMNGVLYAVTDGATLVAIR